MCHLSQALKGRKGGDLSLKSDRGMLKSLVLPAHCDSSYRWQLLFKTLQLTEEPVTSPEHTPTSSASRCST